MIKIKIKFDAFLFLYNFLSGFKKIYYCLTNLGQKITRQILKTLFLNIFALINKNVCSKYFFKYFFYNNNTLYNTNFVNKKYCKHIMIILL